MQIYCIFQKKQLSLQRFLKEKNISQKIMYIL